MDKISVILPTYNSEHTIQRTIDSILDQKGLNTLFGIELLIVDDCSTDNTCKILQENGIAYFSTSSNSGGPNRGRNIGLKNVSGQYFCMIDHDDVWHPDKIQRQLAVARDFPVVSTGYRIIDQHMKRTTERRSGTVSPVKFVCNESFLRKLQHKNNGQKLFMSSLMIHSSLKNILFEEHFGVIDFDWILKITENNHTVEIPECLVTRYVKPENLSLSEDYRKMEYYYSLYILENYRKKYPKESEAGIKRINGTRARYHYIKMI